MGKKKKNKKLNKCIKNINRYITDLEMKKDMQQKFLDFGSYQQFPTFSDELARKYADYNAFVCEQNRILREMNEAHEEENSFEKLEPTDVFLYSERISRGMGNYNDFVQNIIAMYGDDCDEFDLSVNDIYVLDRKKTGPILVVSFESMSHDYTVECSREKVDVFVDSYEDWDTYRDEIKSRARYTMYF